jgi:ribulose-phosphate 3-epimerase
MAEIAPSILAADFARLGDDVAAVQRAGVKIIHVDVMDGHFVPNISIGVPVVASLRKATGLYLDCHLMIENPDAFTPAFIAAGAQNVTIHQEATRHLHRSLQLIKDHGAHAGVALNPATPVETLDHVLDMVDLVLVMSVNPGFGGQKFLPLAISKIEQLAELRQALGLSFKIEVDGGIDTSNIAELTRAGADIFVAGSSIFGTPDAAQAVESLKERIAGAQVVHV